MKATEKANHRKYTDLVALSKKHPEKMAKVPAFQRIVQNIATDIAPVADIDRQAQQSTKGVTADKNILHAALKMSVGRLCRVIIGHATHVGNVVLASDLTVLKKKFSKASMADFADVCKEVVTEARKLVAHWVDYGIIEADVVDIEAKIELFKAKLPIGDAIKTLTKKAVKQRAIIFKALGATKKQILNTAAAYIGADDEFHQDILDAMKVGKSVSIGQIKVVFKSAETQKPVVNQFARILDTDMAEKSDNKGIIRFKFTKSGVQNIHIPLSNGDIKVQKDVAVKLGKTTTVTVLI